jgi:hypothetical protein
VIRGSVGLRQDETGGEGFGYSSLCGPTDWDERILRRSKQMSYLGYWVHRRTGCLRDCCITKKPNTVTQLGDGFNEVLKQRAL